MNPYIFNPEICPNFQDPYQETNANEFNDLSLLHPFDECNNPCSQFQELLPLDNNGDPIEVPDIPETCFNYISNLLREDYSDDYRAGATLQDYMAAQVSYNKSLDAAILLGEGSSFSDFQSPPTVCQNARYYLNDYLNMFSTTNNQNTSNLMYGNASCSENVGQSNLIGNHSNDLGCNISGNLPLGLGGNSNNNNTLDGLVESHVINQGLENQQYGEDMNFLSSGNWEFSVPVANGSTSGRGKEPIHEVRAEEQRCNSLGFAQGGGNFEDWNMNMNLYSNTHFDPTLLDGSHIGVLPSNCRSSCADGISRMVGSEAPIGRSDGNVQGVVQCQNTSDKSRGRKHDEGGERENQEEETGRSNKQLAPSNEVFEQIEKYGDVLLCPEGRSKPAGLCSTLNKANNPQENPKDGSSSKGSKKRGNKGQVVDLRGLLTRCAQCVARVDLTSAYDLLKQIRQHSSPYGDCLQRVAHYLANGLEARLEGKGMELTRANEPVPPCDVLKANRVYVASVPFKIMSYYTTNKTIAKLVEEAPSIHIVDFGIFYGLQWPCIIQNLSKRPNGPPKIRITGIDFPQRGFRPAERVEETGRCLARYCEMYNVPFEYNAIAKNWETIELEDLKIERNEPLVVNCLYRSHNLFDESIEENSPRDLFLSLVRQINPDIFMHGIVNSTLSVPFFLNRFKEAMFHYTSLFDVFEATMSREDNERLLLESKLYGNQALNVIACEGMQRVERPESYKQWQVRTQRAGFEQVPLDRDLLKRARAMVRRNFREEFSYDEDCHWVVQGWKGRILYAISCWKPV